MAHDPIFELPVLQQWMQLVITHPGGIESGLNSPEAQQQIPLEQSELESVIPRSQQLSSLDRLRVYGNAYYTRLVECLGEEFPALKFALGEENFAGFAFAYLQSYPSASYTLDDLGRNFPQFLEQTRPQDRKADWVDFLVELARLERTYADVFDSPGMEELEPFNVHQLAAIPPDQWEQLTLEPAPTLRLLELKVPVHLYATAVKNDEGPTLPQAEKTWLVVFRWDYVVRRAVDELQFRLLEQLCAGTSLGTALSETLEGSPLSQEELAIQLREWFTFWAKWRFFSGNRLQR
ncbi:MAG: DNA-binding domain-containing protein [Planctomycetaceae bacterium]